VMQADILSDEIIDIADESENDWYTDDRGERRIDREVVQRSAIRIDARKWRIAHLNPKKYGAKASLEVTNTTKTNAEIAWEEMAKEKGIPT
jgi:hypothetical protein